MTNRISVLLTAMMLSVTLLEAQNSKQVKQLVHTDTWPIHVGTISNGSDVHMAGSDQLDVTFYGSAPENAKDPIVMASNAVMQYQTIISRNIAAQDEG